MASHVPNSTTSDAPTSLPARPRARNAVATTVYSTATAISATETAEPARPAETAERDEPAEAAEPAETASVAGPAEEAKPATGTVNGADAPATPAEERHGQ